MKIDVFQDSVCPWCRIGKRHLKLALERWQGEPVQVRYRPFFLDPRIPAEGVDFRAHMSAKGGGRIPLEQFFDAPRRQGAMVGLTFNFERIIRAPNSLLSHRLIALVPNDQREVLLDAVYAAYFEHGQDIGDLDTLVGVAAAHGLDAEHIRAQLQGDAGLDEALADAEWAQRAGIGGVPFFIINDQYGFSGAQSPEAILRALEQVAELNATEREPS
jgi:predicted DsbA family dithiol-disulfide isomerase